MVKVIRKNKAKTIGQQLSEVLNIESTTAPKRKWNNFFGKVHFDNKPVAYQRKLRDEE
jgi:hypothetical protein